MNKQPITIILTGIYCISPTTTTSAQSPYITTQVRSELPNSGKQTASKEFIIKPRNISKANAQITANCIPATSENPLPSPYVSQTMQHKQNTPTQANLNNTTQKKPQQVSPSNTTLEKRTALAQSNPKTQQPARKTFDDCPKHFFQKPYFTDARQPVDLGRKKEGKNKTEQRKGQRLKKRLLQDPTAWLEPSEPVSEQIIPDYISGQDDWQAQYRLDFIYIHLPETSASELLRKLAYEILKQRQIQR